MKLSITFAQSLFSAFFLWFGLYLLTRRKNYLAPLSKWWDDPTFFIGALMILVSWQFFGVARRNEAFTPETFLFWVKVTWWVSPISMFFWFYSSFLIYKANTKAYRFKNIFNLLLILFGVLGAVLAGFGTFTEWIFVYSRVQKAASTLFSQYNFPSNWGAVIYILYQIILPFIAFHLILSAKKQVRGNHRVESALQLALHGSFFAAIGLFLIIYSGFVLNLLIPEQFGDLLLTIGFIMIAISILQYNASIKKRIPYTDLWRSFGGVAIANLFYIFFFELFFWRYGKTPNHRAALLSTLIYLTTLIHTPLEWGKTFLDRTMPKFLIPDWEKQYLEKMNQIQFKVLTTPDPQGTLENAKKELQEAASNAQVKELSQLISSEIEKFFSHKEFEKNEVLAQSKLFKLQIVSNETIDYVQSKKKSIQSLTYLEHAEIIRIFLTKMVSQLCQNHQSSPNTPLSTELIGCIILQEKYINSKSRKEVDAVIKRYGFLPSGGTYSRFLQNGRTLLSQLILEKELAHRASPEHKSC